MCAADLGFTGGKNDIGACTDTDFIGACTPASYIGNVHGHILMWTMKGGECGQPLTSAALRMAEDTPLLLRARYILSVKRSDFTV